MAYSLGGGVEHILCAGSGTHEPLLEHTDTSSLCGSSTGSQLKLMLAPSVVSEKGLKVTPVAGEGSEQFTEERGKAIICIAYYVQLCTNIELKLI